MASNTIESYGEKVSTSTDVEWLTGERKRILLAMKDGGVNPVLEVSEAALFKRLNRILPEQDKSHTLLIGFQGLRIVISLLCFESGDHL